MLNISIRSPLILLVFRDVISRNCHLSSKPIPFVPTTSLVALLWTSSIKSISLWKWGLHAWATVSLLYVTVVLRIGENLQQCRQVSDADQYRPARPVVIVVDLLIQIGYFFYRCLIIVYTMWNYTYRWKRIPFIRKLDSKRFWHPTTHHTLHHVYDLTGKNARRSRSYSIHVVSSPCSITEMLLTLCWYQYFVRQQLKHDAQAQRHARVQCV
jgi:hypothetical protein